MATLAILEYETKIELIMNGKQAYESHVLYLFGAGASAEAIPVVHGLPEDMKKIAGRLTEWYQNTPQVPPEIKERAEIICIDLEDLADKVNNFKAREGIEYTVDKYISSLEKKQSTEAQVKYEKSKNTLATYILLRHFFNNDEHIQLDERYGDWLRNVVPDRKEETFANNIRCLTWNYDLQMEFAYYQHFYKEKPGPPGKIINAFSYPQPFPTVATQPQLGIHLNGIVLPTDIQFTGDGHSQGPFTQFINRLFHIMLGAEHLEGNFSSSDKGIQLLTDLLILSQDCTLQFHWDRLTNNQLGTDAVLNKAVLDKTVFEKAACIVIVGYSFPGCNGNMDSEIIRSIKNSQYR